MITLVMGSLLSACSGEVDDEEGQERWVEEIQNADGDSDGDVGYTFETYFTEPAVGAPDRLISELVIDLLAQTPAGAEVRGAFYSFSVDAIGEAMVEAYERGVDIKIVLGNTNRTFNGRDWSAVAILRDGLGENLTICQDGRSDGGCLGENINHNKFLLISELEDGSKHVVVQSSGNLTDFQTTQYDNVLKVTGDEELYEGFLKYWTDMSRDRRDANYNGEAQGTSPTEAYFSPYTKGDPVLEDIERLDCTEGGEIYLAMAFFTNYRVEIAEKMRSMDSEGCDVGVILRHSEISSPGTRIGDNLLQGTIDVGYLSSDEEIQLHSKYLIYRVGEESVVWTGSHNYTRSALHENDEVLIRVADDEVYDAYQANWEFVRSRAEQLHP